MEPTIQVIVRGVDDSIEIDKQREEEEELTTLVRQLFGM